ncbi:MAG: GIY-YIG nuclease family protein [Thermomicrobiales bacterium]
MHDTRKAVKAAYKERTSPAGIYVVRCAASSEAWVGQSPTLDTIQNRLWFTMRFGGQGNRAMQQAWREHGETAFRFEVLERLDDEIAPVLRRDALKARLRHWQATLGAELV